MHESQWHRRSHARTPVPTGRRREKNLERGLVLAANPQTTQDPITIALVEENRLVREALTMLLNRTPDLRVIGEDAEGGESILQELDPDVVLLDLGLANGDGLRLARKVVKDFPDARIIVRDLVPAGEEVSDFVKAGVSGFLMKDAVLEDVLSTIRAVAAGEKVIPDRMTTKLFSEIARESVANGRPSDQESVRLTPREGEVIALIAKGMSNKAIGKELHISTHTVKSHLRNIMEKLTLHSRLQVANYAHQQGGSVIRPPDREPRESFFPVCQR